MSDPADSSVDDRPEREAPASGDSPEPDAAGEGVGDPDLDELRAAVEEKYDFDDFGPGDMAEMTGEEWEAAFDPDSWITGRDLLDRVEKDLRNRIATREVFAVLDRRRDPESVVAYSDEGFAVVYPDGSIEGEGTVLRDVKPSVALCSMDSYEVREPPTEYELPSPEDVESGTGEFGNRMLQAVAAGQLLCGIGLGVVWMLGSVTTVVAPVMAAFFVFVGLCLFAIVANARLSDRFRAEEYRDRLRAAGIGDDGRRTFAPFEEVVDEALAEARERGTERGVPAGVDDGSAPRETTETDG
ncbi:DUF7319 domain-containing protein [Halorarum salinum]|uniref:DUF7319 domain-containing protein n=1 Tax=Halorarum salinum TaxID=2743089 RepID=A0A7D5LBY2_9EURY|nr:hypothetical protein [Halobaculum salinum]QLG63133.1 hypothetical protein HUG12_15895 [Halobaculum salinum]